MLHCCNYSLLNENDYLNIFVIYRSYIHTHFLISYGKGKAVVLVLRLKGETEVNKTTEEKRYRMWGSECGREGSSREQRTDYRREGETG